MVENLAISIERNVVKKENLEKFATHKNLEDELKELEENMKKHVSAEIQKSKDMPVIRKVDSRVNNIVKTLKRKKAITEKEEGVLLKSSPFSGELAVQ